MKFKALTAAGTAGRKLAASGSVRSSHQQPACRKLRTDRRCCDPECLWQPVAGEMTVAEQARAGHLWHAVTSAACSHNWQAAACQSRWGDDSSRRHAGGLHTACCCKNPKADGSQLPASALLPQEQSADSSYQRQDESTCGVTPSADSWLASSWLPQAGLPEHVRISWPDAGVLHLACSCTGFGRSGCCSQLTAS